MMSVSTDVSVSSGPPVTLDVQICEHTVPRSLCALQLAVAAPALGNLWGSPTELYGDLLTIPRMRRGCRAEHVCIKNSETALLCVSEVFRGQHIPLG